MSSFAGIASDTTSATLAGQESLITSAFLEGAAGGGAFSHNKVPWNDIAKWTHGLPKTPTDKWMDVVDGSVRGANHRWQNHHLVDFLSEYVRQGPAGELKILDYLRHISLDLITVKGIPTLPENLHLMLQQLGVSEQLICNWSHVNILEIAVGGMSIGGGAPEMILSITGHLPWEGIKTLVLTFGMGGFDIAAGIATENPFLVMGGAMQCTSGGISYWQHIHVPTQSMLPHIIHGLLGGVASGCVASALRLALTWGTTTRIEKVGIASESLALSSTLGCLAIISPWLSIPLGLSYGLGKFAFRCAKSENDYWEKMPISSPLTEQLARETIEMYGGQEALCDFDCFRAKPIEYATHPDFLETDPDLLQCLETIPDWGETPADLKHVLAPHPL